MPPVCWIMLFCRWVMCYWGWSSFLFRQSCRLFTTENSLQSTYRPKWVGRSDRLNVAFPGSVTQTVICYQVNIADCSILPYSDLRGKKKQLSTFSHISLVSSLAVIHKFDYVFAENGTVQYKDGKLLSKHVSEHTVTFIMLCHNVSWYATPYLFWEKYIGRHDCTTYITRFMFTLIVIRSMFTSKNWLCLIDHNCRVEQQV